MVSLYGFIPRFEAELQILYSTCNLCVPMPVLFTFVATENVGAVCELIDNDRLEGLLAKSKQPEGGKCETPLLLPQVSITEDDT